ncbi:hypothetical protein PIB30_014724 [Stylosanthes scabra]|uniref:Uncharacterized protein n=1 Tax=Stylosanthes scabra TaxID=79078 RepID=A0ABU6W6V1_9FABA|nr:hypothetical protein [Stylosanthes scabra]
MPPCVLTPVNYSLSINPNFTKPLLGHTKPPLKNLRRLCPRDIDGSATKTQFSRTRTSSLPSHTDVVSAIAPSSVRSSVCRPLPSFVSSEEDYVGSGDGLIEVEVEGESEASSADEKFDDSADDGDHEDYFGFEVEDGNDGATLMPLEGLWDH